MLCKGLAHIYVFEKSPSHMTRVIHDIADVLAEMSSCYVISSLNIASIICVSVCFFVSVHRCLCRCCSGCVFLLCMCVCVCGLCVCVCVCFFVFVLAVCGRRVY